MCLSLGLLRILRNVWVWEGTVVGLQAEDLRLVIKKVTGKLDLGVYIFLEILPLLYLQTHFHLLCQR